MQAVMTMMQFKSSQIPIIFFLFLKLTSTTASDILFLLPITTVSHRVFLLPFLEGLASRGHNVTLLTNMEKSITDKITEIPYTTDNKIFDALNNVSFKTRRNRPWEAFIEAERSMSPRIADSILKQEVLHQFIKEKKKFDLVFVAGLFDHIGIPIANFLTDNIIFMQFMRVFPPFSDFLDLSVPYSAVPFTMSFLKSNMTFMERLWNSWISLYHWYFLSNLSGQDALISETFNQTSEARKVYEKIHLVFENSDPVISHSTPSKPHAIPIGGLNCQEPKPLPQNLESIFDSSGDHGVIYFSLGTVVNIRTTADNLPEKFLSVFARLKQTVIWKSRETFPNSSPNVHFLSWVPQQDILGHPKTRLYITQGGIFSLQETVYHGVPIVGLPIMTDQFNNVMRMEELGLGKYFNVFELSEEALYTAITSVLNDTRYSKTAKIQSGIFKNQMESPLERAIFWTEYALRHPGSSHLRNGMSHLDILTHFSLDVLFTVFIISLPVLWFTYRFAWFARRVLIV